MSYKKDCLRCRHMDHYINFNVDLEVQAHLYICTATQPDVEDGVAFLMEVNEFDPKDCLNFKEEC